MVDIKRRPYLPTDPPHRGWNKPRDPYGGKLPGVHPAVWVWSLIVVALWLAVGLAVWWFR